MAALGNRRRQFALSVFVTLWVVTLAGCAFALPAPTPPSQEQVRIIAKAPEQYALQVKTWAARDYVVPHEGNVNIDIPSYRRTCGVYLFNAIKVGGDKSPLGSWSLLITRNGKPVRELSLQALRELKTDPAGYHMLKVRD